MVQDDLWTAAPELCQGSQDMTQKDERPSLSMDDLGNFRGQIVPVTLAGERSIYRFSDAPMDRNDPKPALGKWWFSEEVFLMIYNEARDNSSRSSSTTLGTEYRRLFSRYLAISIGFGTLFDLYRMDIPENGTVSGWKGIAAAQPRVSSRLQDEHGVPASGTLPGGLEQYFIERYNPTWVRRVSL